MTETDRPVTYSKFLAMRAELLERLELLPLEWLKLLVTNNDTTGKPQTLLDTSGRLAAPGTVQSDAEASDGTALVGTPAPMEAVSVQVSSDGTGAIASTAVLAAGGAGVKYVIYEVTAQGVIAATPGAPAGALMVFSDTGIVIAVPGGGQGRALGPQKQGTANTAVNVSASAGTCTASCTFTITVRYRRGA